MTQKARKEKKAWGDLNQLDRIEYFLLNEYYNNKYRWTSLKVILFSFLFVILGILIFDVFAIPLIFEAFPVWILIIKLSLIIFIIVDIVNKCFKYFAKKKLNKKFGIVK